MTISQSTSTDTLSTNVAWALRLVWLNGRRLTIANIVLTVLQSLLPLLGLYLTKLLVDEVAGGLNTPDPAAIFGDVLFLVVLLGAVILFERVLSTLANLVSTAQSHTVTDQVYKILHAKSIEMDLEFYENSDYYDSLHRAQMEAPYRPTRILNGIFSLGQSGISLAAIVALLLTFHWSVPIFIFLSTLPSLFVRLRYAKTLYLWSRRQTPGERRASYLNSMLTQGNYAKEIRLFNLGETFATRFDHLRSQIRRERLDLLRKRSLADLMAEAGAIIPVFGLLGFLAYRALHGLMTIGDLVMFYQAVNRGQSYLNQLLRSIADLYENNLFLTSVHEFLDLKPKVTAPDRPTNMVRVLKRGIVFENVTFQYPGSNRAILREISLQIRAGEHIALVGENGSGKTTLVKLLARLYDPSEGRITFDGIDIRDFSLTELRQHISVVFQDYAKYQLTAKENIWFGNIRVPPEEEPIIHAARMAGADHAIDKLRNGYDTVLGKWFEDGQELSIGEWQKIAIARAFLRDAEIIILDEPTSALDAKSEYEVFKKFHQLSKGRTAILISHRLSTVKMADHIYFLDDGVIVEAGTHDELIASRGKYAEMFEKQAAHYR